eukprot:1781652-Prymnesium_polylepis.1
MAAASGSSRGCTRSSSALDSSGRVLRASAQGEGNGRRASFLWDWGNGWHHVGGAHIRRSIEDPDMTRQRGASRGVNSQKYNQNSKTTPSEAPSKAITQATIFATPTDEIEGLPRLSAPGR